MKPYQKIETLYTFDLTTKKFTDTFYNPLVENLKDYTWVFTEKVDGTNLRIHWDGNKLSYGGRTEKSTFSKRQIEYIESNLVTKEREQVFEHLFQERWVTIYGELFGFDIGAEAKGYNPDQYDFKVFDVMLGIAEKPLREKYVSRKVMEDISKDLQFNVVPIVLEGTIADALEYVRNNKQSTFSAAPLEGVVGKLKWDLLDENGKRLIIKIKHRDLEEENK